jgi:hypothetical protein
MDHFLCILVEGDRGADATWLKRGGIAWAGVIALWE